MTCCDAGSNGAHFDARPALASGWAISLCRGDVAPLALALRRPVRSIGIEGRTTLYSFPTAPHDGSREARVGSAYRRDARPSLLAHSITEAFFPIIDPKEEQ